MIIDSVASAHEANNMNTAYLHDTHTETHTAAAWCWDYRILNTQTIYHVAGAFVHLSH